MEQLGNGYGWTNNLEMATGLKMDITFKTETISSGMEFCSIVLDQKQELFSFIFSSDLKRTTSRLIFQQIRNTRSLVAHPHIASPSRGEGGGWRGKQMSISQSSTEIGGNENNEEAGFIFKFKEG